MLFLFKHPKEAERLGRAATEKTSRYFTLEQMVAGYQAVLVGTLASAGSESVQNV
jgi:hypothetical protein